MLAGRTGTLGHWHEGRPLCARIVDVVSCRHDRGRAEADDLSQALSSEERDRASRLRSDDHRDAVVVARGRLRQLLGGLAGPHSGRDVLIAHPLDRLELVRLLRAVTYRLSRPPLASMYRPGSEALDVLSAMLGGFADDVRAQGAVAVVVVFPGEGEIIAERAGRAKVHGLLLNALKQRAIPTIDLVDSLGKRARDSSLGDLVKGHYRPLGNAIVARTLADELPRLTAATCGHGHDGARHPAMRRTGGAGRGVSPADRDGHRVGRSG